MFGAGEANVQLDARDAEGDLARAGVAEAPRPQGDVDPVGFAFDEAVVEGSIVFVVKIDRDRPAPPFGVGRTETRTSGTPLLCVIAVRFSNSQPVSVLTLSPITS